MPQHDRPNIVLVMSDQHNKHIAGCYGDRVIRTPHLDALAERGVTFTNAYGNFPLCAPARMTFMTGRQPCELGIWDNGGMLGSDVPTFAHALGIAGYETVLCGRMHFNGPDQRHGFHRRIFPEVSGHAAGQLVGTNGFRRTSMEVSGPGRNHYLLYDEQCTAAGVEWLAERTRGSDDRPFCLVVGLVGPHCPFVCPRDLFDYYHPRIDVPRCPADYIGRMHPYARGFRRQSRIEDLTDEEIRRTRAAYYGMIEFDDRMVGQLVQALREAGLADNTAVIYTSDHGDMAGEHGLWWKMSFYEGSAGVPLVASFPGRFREGETEPAVVSLVDLAPTLARIGGAPEIPGATGRSLMDLLTGDGAPADRVAFAELWCGPTWTDQGPSGGPARMLRRGDWKCNVYHNEPAELFNLADDPDEMVDRAADPTCRDTLDRMVADIRRDWDPAAVDAAAQAQSDMRAYVRRSPGDRSMLAGEYWLGPENYGCVEPV